MLCSLIDYAPQSSKVPTKPVRGFLSMPKLGLGGTFLFVGEWGGGSERMIEKTGVWAGHETFSTAAPASTDSPLDVEGYPEALFGFS